MHGLHEEHGTKRGTLGPQYRNLIAMLRVSISRAIGFRNHSYRAVGVDEVVNEAKLGDHRRRENEGVDVR